MFPPTVPEKWGMVPAKCPFLQSESIPLPPRGQWPLFTWFLFQWSLWPPCEGSRAAKGRTTWERDAEDRVIWDLKVYFVYFMSHMDELVPWCFLERLREADQVYWLTNSIFMTSFVLKSVMHHFTSCHTLKRCVPFAFHWLFFFF